MQTKETIAKSAYDILHSVYGPDAAFREGQLEAIEAVFENRRTLLVEKTGWGKSLVYFVSAKLLCAEGGGIALIISPLLELMRNQQEAARAFGLVCAELDSSVKDKQKRAQILDDAVNGVIDLLFTTPETLFRDEFQSRLAQMNIGLFVIDEAHCLSDWGHDFRRNYGRLYKVIQMLPSTASVLCTTATANDRVVDDLKKHLGKNVYISRGELGRDSLFLQTLELPSVAERYAWLADHLNELPGTGIIYCLTHRDCDRLCDFLSCEGLAVDKYYSDNDREQDGSNRRAMDRFERNEIKALIATVKLGMGYDKPDIGFVIHYQRPQSIVAYYQQIGRAGRSLSKAYAILMSGPEDDEIAESFIETAFPSEALCREVLDVVGSSNGITESALIGNVNERASRVKNALYFLEFDGFLRKDGSRYHTTPKQFSYDREHYDAITAIRYAELDQMRMLSATDECLLYYVTSCLNDPSPRRCGHCANCAGAPLVPTGYEPETLRRAQEQINNRVSVIQPRKQWAYQGYVGSAAKIAHPLEKGYCLGRYGEPGYGAMVSHDKYHAAVYRNDLLNRAVEVLAPVVKASDIHAVAFVPSLRNNKVEEFSRRLASALGLGCVDLIRKTKAQQQKTMQNSAHQCYNARSSFSLKPGAEFGGNVLLVDDIVDSRWTLAVCGDLLGEAGCPKVVPFCLADSSEGATDND